MTYGQIKCPICGTNIQTTQIIQNCPSCKEYIGDQTSTGVTQAQFDALFGHLPTDDDQ